MTTSPSRVEEVVLPGRLEAEEVDRQVEDIGSLQVEQVKKAGGVHGGRGPRRRWKQSDRLPR